VGTSYFDAVTTTIQGSQASTTALKNSTEDEQFWTRSPTIEAGVRVERGRAAPPFLLCV
jgi:hypothetical protein